MRHLVSFYFVCDSEDLSFALPVCLDISSQYHCDSCSVVDLSVKTFSCDGLISEKVSLDNFGNNK